MRRLARRTAIYALLGVVTSVVVAWGAGALAYRTRPNSTIRVTYDGVGRWKETRAWGTTIAIHWSFAQEDSHAHGRLPYPVEKTAPRWLDPTTVPRDDNAVAIACGWPLRCLTGRADSTRTSGASGSSNWRARDQWIFDIPKSGGLTEFLTNRAFLPLRPVWTGLLLNSALFSTCWALTLFSIPKIGRQIRRRRGRCPTCSYDLNHNLAPGCPECGWRRESAESAAESAASKSAG